MIPPVIEGFVVDGPLPSAHPRVSRWLLGGDGGEAFVGGEALVERARLLPSWGPFDPVRIVDHSVVVVPGRLVTAIPELARRLTPGARVALAWHVAGYIAQLHEGGDAHGAIDSGSVGLDESGRLHVRPALHLDRDETAAAQVYDCLLLGRLFHSLHLEETGDRNVALVLQGLQGERIRLAPGWAVRQALMAILVRHPEWEKELVAALGAGFRLDALDELEPPPPSETDDEVSLEADDSEVDDSPTSPSFVDRPWAELPVAEEDPPQTADEETESFPRAVEPVAEPVEVAEPTPIESSAPPEPPKPNVPSEPEEEPGAPVPDTPPQLPQEEPEEAPDEDEPVRDPDEAPDEDPEEAPTNPPQEQPDGRAAAAVEEDDEPSFDVLDLVPPDDAPEISLIGPGRTRELVVAWHEDTPVMASVPEEIDVVALAASVAAAVDELPPVETRWPAEEVVEPTPVETVVPINEWVSTSVEEPVSMPAEDPVSFDEPVVSVEESVSAPVVEPVVSVEEPVVTIEELVSVPVEEPVSVTAPRPVPTSAPAPVSVPVEDEPEPETVIGNPRAPAQRSELEFLDEPDTHDTGSQAPLFEPAVQADDLPEPPRAPPPRRIEPVVLDEPRDGDAKWMAARGVTHDSARDAELGSGKWTEPARPLEELARELPKSPTRSMETVDGGTSTGTWLGLAVLSFVLFAGAFFGFRSSDEKVATPPAVHATLRTQPDGAEVLVDGRTLGVSPVEVTLPEAGRTIEVCAVWAGDRHCQKLIREQLEKGYTFARP